MKNKTCGECRFYNEDFNFCLHWRYVDITESSGICNYFAPLTNGDVIRQGGDRALAHFKSEHKCDVCAYAAPIDTVPACQRPDGKVCYDGILDWLNAPAESEVTNG